MKRSVILSVEPEGDGEWHWLYQADRVEIFLWTASSRVWSMARWPIFLSPTQAAKEGWSYLRAIQKPTAPGPVQRSLAFPA
jgi:hypothetical protein